MKEFHPAREIASEQSHQFTDCELKERGDATGFELRRQASAKIRLDLRPAKRSEVIDPCPTSIGAAEQAAVFLELVGIRQRQEELVGKQRGGGILGLG